MNDLIKKVSLIQKELKATKGQFNKFGNFYYRSCEDIIEAVKPILAKYELVLNINDDIQLIGDRFYIKATAKITDGTNEISATAFAREPNEQKGMNESQITGSASSYARKYALNGLLAIDDNKDADTNEYVNQTNTPLDNDLLKELEDLGGDLQMVADYYKKNVNSVTNNDVKKLVEAKKKRLQKQNEELKKRLENKSEQEVKEEIEGMFNA